MPEFNAPENISVEEFFKSYVPEFFAKATSEADLSMMKGREFTMQFDIDGKRWCMKITDGDNLEVIEDGVEKPMLTLKLSEPFWREAVTGKISGLMGLFTDPQQVADLNRYNALQNTAGSLNLQLKRESGEVVPLTITFNGTPEPAITLKMDIQDWIDIQNGEANGQALFMQGKIGFEGDMSFLMQLQALM